MNQPTHLLAGILLLISLSSCNKEKAYVETGDIAKTLVDESDVLLAKVPNRKKNITALFYGTNTVFKDKSIKPVSNIEFVILKENDSGNRILYQVANGSTQAYGFYFTNIWSPDEESLILPRGKQDGFIILDANALLKKNGHDEIQGFRSSLARASTQTLA
jgi:hypothetical protein